MQQNINSFMGLIPHYGFSPYNFPPYFLLFAASLSPPFQLLLQLENYINGKSTD